MSGSNPADWANDFQALAQQYWQSWGDFAQQARGAPAGLSPGQGWQQAIDWWTKLAHGGREEANTALDRFNQQMRHGYGLMQELAGRFAGQSGSASDIVKAWRQAIGANGSHPFPELFKGLHGHGLQGIEQLLGDASPFLGSVRDQILQSLKQPAFGFAREHQERWQRLMLAQVTHQEEVSRYNALLAKAGENAFARFESLLAQRDEPGRQLGSARALFDLWIDAAEEAYAEIALSEEFRKVYGDMVNAQMRLRGAVQLEVEHSARALGMPTRTEVQAGHAKVHALERELRRLRKRLEALEQSDAPLAHAVPASASDPSEASSTTRPTVRAKSVSESKPKPKSKSKAKSKPKPKSRRVATPVADVVVPAPAPDWWGNRVEGRSAAARKTSRKAAASTKAKSKPKAKSKTARAQSARAEPAATAKVAKPAKSAKPARSTKPSKPVKSVRTAAAAKPVRPAKARSKAPPAKTGKASKTPDRVAATRAGKNAKPAKSPRRRS